MTGFGYNILGFGAGSGKPPLIVDFLVVGGGGSGGSHNGGGGGAGGFREFTSQELDRGTAFTVTVGAGASGVSNAGGTQGSNSVFGSFTSAVEVVEVIVTHPQSVQEHQVTLLALLPHKETMVVMDHQEVLLKEVVEVEQVLQVQLQAVMVVMVAMVLPQVLTVMFTQVVEVARHLIQQQEVVELVVEVALAQEQELQVQVALVV